MTSQEEKGPEQEFTAKNRIKAKYSRTSMKKKQQLINYVMNQNFSLYKASKRLKISNSTSTFILTNYRKYGTILERNSKAQIEKHFKNVIAPHQTEQFQIRIKSQPILPEFLPQEAPTDRSEPMLNTGAQQFYFPYMEFYFPFFNTQSQL